MNGLKTGQDLTPLSDSKTQKEKKKEKTGIFKLKLLKPGQAWYLSCLFSSLLKIVKVNKYRILPCIMRTHILGPNFQGKKNRSF